MILGWTGQVGERSFGVSRRLWIGSRIAALLIGALLVFGLFSLKPLENLVEPPVVQGVQTAIDAPRPKRLIQAELPKEPTRAPASTTGPLPPTLKAARQRIAVPMASPSAVQDRPTPTIVVPLNGGTTSALSVPKIASASSTNASSPNSPAMSNLGAPTPTVGQSGQQGTSTRRLGGNTLAILKARECARLDVRDRPADCPPNEELARLLAQERGPQYRRENADGFSRNELAWRGVPPPCLADGENLKSTGFGACVRFGNVPSRVRSVSEICEARGLGGCADAPNQTAVNAAIAQARRQQTAKAP